MTHLLGPIERLQASGSEGLTRPAAAQVQGARTFSPCSRNWPCSRRTCAFDSAKVLPPWRPAAGMVSICALCPVRTPQAHTAGRQVLHEVD